MREDFQDLADEWERCADVCHKLMHTLQECTEGPRTAVVAAQMLLVTLCSICEIEEERLRLMMDEMWEVYKAAEKEQTH